MISMHAVAGDILYKAMIAVGGSERMEEGQKKGPVKVLPTFEKDAEETSGPPGGSVR